MMDLLPLLQSFQLGGELPQLAEGELPQQILLTIGFALEEGEEELGDFLLDDVVIGECGFVEGIRLVLPHQYLLSMAKEYKDCSVGDLVQEYDEEVITEWERAYIGFSSLKYYLLYLKNVYERHHHEFFRHHEAHIEILPLEEETARILDDLVTFIDSMRKLGREKVQQFIRYKADEIIYLWEELLVIIAESEASGREEHEMYEKRSDMKLLIRIIYGNIDYLQQFIALNKKIDACLTHVITDYVLPFKKDYLPPNINTTPEMSDDSNSRKSFGSMSEEIRPEDSASARGRKGSFASQQGGKGGKASFASQKSSTRESESEQMYLQHIQKAAKDLHSSMVFLNKDQECKLREFTRFSTKFTSTKNYFLLGLYIGLGAVIFISLVVLLVLNFITLAYDDQRIDSMNYIFPMFRGVGLLILYFWGMAWNVYGFAAYKINFKNILEYGSHYSTHFQIMKRAGFFTLVFCLMLFLYLLGLEINENSSVRMPIEYTPFIVWTVYFLYIFFPNRDVFNPRGRKYFYLLLKKIALSPFVKMSFLLSYASDQMVSFVVPIKDFAYTLCFYTSDFSVNEVKSCLKSDTIDGIIIAYVVALVPLLIRMVQCFKQARQSTGKFIGHLQMWNFFKYFASVMTSTLSFLNSLHPSLLPFFILSSVISTSYSYYWDLKNDWGFLEKGAKHRFLRNHLCYKNKYIYYIAIFLNLIFRCSWTLTISPSVVKLIPKSTFLPFLTGLIEILRRCMWNFFRIEKEHVINCAAYSIIKEKPEDILKRLRQQKVSKSFKVIDDGESSIIHYVKLSNQESMAYYRKLMSMELPLISKQTVMRQREQFERMVSEEKKEAELWQKQLKGHIFYDVKEKFY